MKPRRDPADPLDAPSAPPAVMSRRRRRRRRIAAVGVVLVAAATVQWHREVGLQLAGRWYASQAGGPSIDVAGAAELMDEQNATVVDVRAAGEFAVSHLPGAVHVSMKDIESGRLPPGITQQRPVVVYCTIGYRSGVAAERLANLGYDARSVRGGILRLARAGRRLEGPDGPTLQVHTWKRSLAWMLPPAYEAVYPDD